MPDVHVPRVRPLVVVVGLGQPPDVVVAEVVVVGLSGAHLVVERLGVLVPHPLQEVQAELGLAGEVRAGSGAHLARERRDALQQDGLGVTGRLDEVQVVARVPPAAGGVDPHPRRVLGQAALEVAVPVHRRGPVRHRAGVAAVTGRGAQRGVDEVRAVPLVLVEVQRVGQRLGVDLRGRADREPGRGGRRVAEDTDPVAARRVQPGEPGRPHPAVPLAPGAEVGGGQPGRGHRAGPGPDHHPAQRAGRLRLGHDLGLLDRPGRVADLVHPDRGGRRASRRPVRAGGQHRAGGRLVADLLHRRAARRGRGGLRAGRAGRRAQPQHQPERGYGRRYPGNPQQIIHRARLGPG